MSHRRLASLALAAALVLLLGLLTRGKLKRANQSTTAAPPSEASALQQLSHEGLLRRASSFVAERVSDGARYVVYVPTTAASGVRWRADTVLSAGLHHAVDVSRTGAADSETPELARVTDSVRSDWLVIVARARTGRILSLVGAAGGIVKTPCGSREVDALLLNVPLQEQLVGAGVFDIDGALAGIVLRCGERLAAIPTRQIAALLKLREPSTSEANTLGASLAALDSLTRVYFGTDTGALVIAVRNGSDAERIGLRPGDILHSIDGVLITTPSDITRGIASQPGAAHDIVRKRGRTRTVVRIAASGTAAGGSTDAPNAGLGLALAPERSLRGVPLDAIQPGSPAQAAGLRVGDRLTRVGTTFVTSRADAERLLKSASTGPVFIAFDRDSVERGVMVRP